MKKTGIIAFTEHGCVLGEKLLRDLQKQDQEIYGFVKSKYVDLPERHSFQKVTGTLREWAEEWIPKLDGIIFFSATGIAVRTIAPFVVSKKTDPAVVVIDEQGNYAISLLSGHLGGANELAKFAAESIGAVPVITTGTDVNHTFAVDVFARKNNLVIADMRLAKEMAALLIRGKTITWGAGEGFVYPKGQNIPLQVKKERSRILIALGKEHQREYMEQFLGQEKEVLFEEQQTVEGQEYWTGHTMEYLKIAVISEENLENKRVMVQLREMIGQDLILAER